MGEPQYEIDEITTSDTWRIFRVMAEMVEGFETLGRIGPAVSIFGSKRSTLESSEYKTAEKIAYKLAERGFAVITGGGAGIMEAGNKGAREAGGTSVGLNILLSQEQANHYQNVSLDFHYFFIRKLMFIRYAVAFVILPGGYGSLDELFEALTLMQTHRIKRFPLYLVGTTYWTPLVKWLRDTVNKGGLVKDDELDLITVIDDPDELVEQIAWCEKERCYDLPDGIRHRSHGPGGTTGKTPKES